MRQLSVADVAAEIAGRGVPALFVDTCATLDVVRCAWRGVPRLAGIVRQVIDAHAAGELLLYAPSVLGKEAARNRVGVEGEAQREARAVDGTISAYREAAQRLGVAYPYGTAYSHADLVPPLVGLHDQLLAGCTHVLPETGLMLSAVDRASDNRRPARKGGGMNDCILFEEFRGVARAAPAAGPLVLLTTNPSDFGDKVAGVVVVHADITGDLAGTRAQVCFDWNNAARLVLTKARLRSI